VFSSRSRFGTEENALFRAVTAARREGRAFFDLTASNPTEVGLSPTAEALERALTSDAIARYRPAPLGLPVAREAIAAFAGTTAARVVVTASTSEAYALLFKLLCDPGDAVLVPAPSYPLLDVLAQLESVTTRSYPLRYDGEWHVDAGGLAAAMGEDARAIVVVSPNNPTGSYLSPEDRARMLATGRALVVDEVFTPFPLEAPMPITAAAETGLVFRLSGLSKAVALPQMKLGWITIEGEPSLVDEALRRLEHANDAFLSAATPVQVAAPKLLALAGDAQSLILTRCRANLDALDRAIARCPAVSRPRVEAGWYAVVRLPRVRSEEEWALGLLREGVLVQPGWFYDFADEAWAIVSLITPEDVFSAGVDRLVAHVADALG
jgi:alanine-synthesizing transaminase